MTPAQSQALDDAVRMARFHRFKFGIYSENYPMQARKLFQSKLDEEFLLSPRGQTHIRTDSKPRILSRANANTSMTAPRKGNEMKLYVWEGDGVLTDWTNGMVVAIGNNLDEALKALEEKFKAVTGAFPSSRPSHVIEIGPDTKADGWCCWGGG